MDLTWVDAERGWALAAIPCATTWCPRVAATRDGGRSWTVLPTPPGLPADWWTQVSQIRFATSRIGYLFGPDLYQTGDGGRSWRRVPAPPVETLEPVAGSVIRVVYDHLGCPGPCDRTVQEAADGSGTWHTLLRIPLASDNGGITAQVIWPGGPVLYIPVYGNPAGGQGASHAVIFRSTDGGGSWQRLTDPCGGTGLQTHTAVELAAAPGGFVAALCASISGLSRTYVRVSADFGSSWGPPRTVFADSHLIAAAGPAWLVVATGGVGGSGPFSYRLAVSANDGRRWTTEIVGSAQLTSGAPAAAFLEFDDSGVGWWVSDEHDFWTTDDGGLHWLRLAFP